MITKNNESTSDVGLGFIPPLDTDIESTLRRLERENDLLKECVRFYATIDNWYADEVISYHTARECLESIGDDL